MSFSRIPRLYKLLNLANLIIVNLLLKNSYRIMQDLAQNISNLEHPMKKAYLFQTTETPSSKGNAVATFSSSNNTDSLDFSQEMQSIVIVNDIDVKDLLKFSKDDKALSIEDKKFAALSLKLYERKDTTDLQSKSPSSPLSFSRSPRNTVVKTPTNQVKLKTIHSMPQQKMIEQSKSSKNLLQECRPSQPICSPGFPIVSPRNKNVLKPIESTKKKPKLVLYRAQTCNIVMEEAKPSPQKGTPVREKKKVLLPKISLTPTPKRGSKVVGVEKPTQGMEILNRRKWDYQATLEPIAGPVLLDEELRLAKHKRFGTVQGEQFSFSILQEAFENAAGKDEEELTMMDSMLNKSLAEGEEEPFDLTMSTIKGDYLPTLDDEKSTKEEFKMEGNIIYWQKDKLPIKRRNAKGEIKLKEGRILIRKGFDTDKLKLHNYKKVSPTKGRKRVTLVSTSPEEKALGVCRSSSTRKRM